MMLLMSAYHRILLLGVLNVIKWFIVFCTYEGRCWSRQRKAWVL